MGNSQHSANIAVPGKKYNHDVNFGAMDFYFKEKMQISKEYKVRSPPLGIGPMGELREVYHTTLKQRRLIKIIYKYQMDDAELEKVNDEIDILKQLNHPNIMKIYETSEDKLYIYIIMEYFNGRVLFDRIRNKGPLSEAHAVKILKSLLSVLKYLNGKGIVYRDLKLENMLYDGSDIKFMDFSLACQVANNKVLKDIVGSPYYIAPEVLKGKYDKRCDIWSFGIVAYIMMVGKAPFEGSNTGLILDSVLTMEPEYDTQTLTPYAIDFFKRVLVKNPNKRAKLSDIENHKLFRNIEGIEKQYIKDKFIEVWSNMMSFRYENPFQVAIYLFLFNNVIDRNQIKKINDLFRAIDIKGEGYLTKNKLAKFCKDYNLPIEDHEIHKVFNKLSFEGNGLMNYNDFLAGSFSQKELLSEDNIKKCFRVFDEDDSGSISIEEFAMMFPQVDKNQLENFLREFDVDGNGDIDLTEFKAILLAMINSQFGG